MAAQLPAKTSQRPLLPAQLTNVQPRDNSGNISSAINSGLAGAATTGGLLAAASAASPFVAGLMTNPVTAPIGILLGGVFAAAPHIYNWIKQNNVNNKITKSQKALQQLTQLPNQSDPNIQRQIQEQQAVLAQYGNQGSQNQQGSPEGTFWGGRPAYNEQIPLFTPQVEQYRNEVLNQLRNSPANFGPIKEETLRRYHEETAPRIANQYFGRHADSQFGNDYPQALFRSGRTLERQLNADEAQYNANREGRLLNFAAQPSFGTVQHPREAGFRESFLEPLVGNALGSAVNYGGQWLQNRFSPKQEQNPMDLSQFSSNFQNKYPNQFQKLLEGRNRALGGGTR
jgi:hypothetical protein